MAETQGPGPRGVISCRFGWLPACCSPCEGRLDVPSTLGTLMTAAILDRRLRHCHIIATHGRRYQVKDELRYARLEESPKAPISTSVTAPAL